MPLLQVTFVTKANTEQRFLVKRTVLDAQEMARVIRRMAVQIVERERQLERLLLVGIRTRGVPLAERLAEQITAQEGVELPLGVLDITLYRDDLSTIAAKPVVKGTSFPVDIADRVVVLCDDVLYTGRTVRAALDELSDYGRPQAVRLAVLIDRGLRELPIQPDVVGKTLETLPDELVEVAFQGTDEAEHVRLLERPGRATDDEP